MSSSKPKLLFLSAHLPSLHSGQAGQKTALRNLRWLSEKFEVHLIAFRSEAERNERGDELRALCAKVCILNVSTWSRLVGALLNPLAPFAVAARHSSIAQRTIRLWCAETNFARVHVEWTQLGVYLAELGHVPQRTLYVHDVLAQWAARRADSRRLGFIWSIEAARARRWEACHLPEFTRLFTPSAKDCRLLDEGVSGIADRLEVLPLQFENFAPSTPRDFAGCLRLLFWGALGRRENADAARWICDQLLPQLKARGLACHMVIAGSNPPADIQERQSPEIEVTGFIEDPAAVFAHAQLAVLPLFEGAGVKVKILECLAAGLPCITTDIGVEGVEASADDGLLVAESKAESFAQLIADLDADRGRLADLAQKALNWGKRQQLDHREMMLR